MLCWSYHESSNNICRVISIVFNKCSNKNKNWGFFPPTMFFLDNSMKDLEVTFLFFENAYQ